MRFPYGELPLQASLSGLCKQETLREASAWQLPLASIEARFTFGRSRNRCQRTQIMVPMAIKAVINKARLAIST
jgi:hypothetical protein